MLISLSTGSIYRWGDDMNDFIEICRENIKIDGLELMFANRKSLEEFNVNDSNIEWLKTLGHLTLHAPVKILERSNSQKEIKDQLKILESTYRQVNAKAVIFHVTNLPKFEHLNEFNFKYIIENTTVKGGVNLIKFEEVIRQYKSDVCLDVSHAFTWSNEEAKKYEQKLKNNIFQIHLSASRGNHEHLPMSNLSANFDKSIQFLKKINKPIVIESDYNDKDIKFLNADLNLIFNYLKK